MAKKKTERKINHGLIIKIELVILAISGVIGFFQFSNSAPSLKNAIALATNRQPERFTELYFEDHANLPRNIKRWQTYEFEFTIHNLEHRQTTYSYTVTLEHSLGVITLDANTVTLAPEEDKTIPVSFGPLKPERMRVVVSIPNINQDISFWMFPDEEY